MKYKQAIELISSADKIVVIQAENPDGDSISSSLALEEILSNLGKDVYMYCPVDIHTRFSHLAGWDRVQNELPVEFDLSIIVDTSAMTLLEKALAEGNRKKVESKPLLVIDHHGTESDINFATVIINETESVATGQVIYNICQEAGWEISVLGGEFLASSIMSDSLGLVSEGTKPSTIRIIADLVESGVSLAKLDSLRREAMSKSLEITHFKGKLLQRVEVLCDGQLGYIHIPWEEIHEFSHQYNPSMLVLDDMRLIDGVQLSIAIKTYPDGHITGKLRANYGVPVCAKIAERFGGGGHVYASGFKVRESTLEEVRKKLIQYTREALDETL